MASVTGASHHSGSASRAASPSPPSTSIATTSRYDGASIR
jgi:hypothetical protein